MKRLLVVVALCACRPIYEPVSPDPEDGGDAADCPAMCKALERLGCDEEWGIDPEDGPCLEWCVEREKDPRRATMCPAWVARATSCDDANRLSQCGD